MGFGRVDDKNGGFVVFIDWCRVVLGEIEVSKNGPKVLDSFGTQDGGNKFGFGGADSGRWLDFRAVTYGPSTE